MKLKMIQLGVLVFLSVASGTQSFAQPESAGTHGGIQGNGKTDGKPDVKYVGGVAVYKNSQLLFRDLADPNKTDCSINNSRTFLEGTKLGKTLEEILAANFQTHPLMAYKIRNEFSKVSWCITQNLKPIMVDDEDAVTEGYEKDVQVAVRDIDAKRVYLDVTKLKKMPYDHQAMNLIHEIAHSFLPVGFKMRNGNLRTMVKKIHETYLASLKNQNPTPNFIENLNQTIIDTGFLPTFKTVETGKALQAFVTAPSESTAAALASELDHVDQLVKGEGKTLKEFVQMVVQELGRADLLAYTAFNKSIFNQDRERVLDRLPSQFHLEKPILVANQFFSVAHDGKDDTGNFTLDHERFPVGSCMFNLTGSLNVRMAGLSAYDKDTISFSYLIEKEGFQNASIGMRQSYTQHSILVWVPLSESAYTKFTADQRNYYSQIHGLMNQLRNGYCNNASASGARFFK